MPTRPPSFIAHLNASRRAVSGGAVAGSDRANTVSQAEADRFRSSRTWKRIRAQVLREEPLCQDCKGEGRTELAVTVDHVVPLQVNLALARVRTNLRSLCASCHARKSAKERAR